ncbi:uncharacterized protein LOC128545985 [Mercenaria mercenaria]|uniref:uncharacterized protein LOC128545985 n=1 Tax=Mercenaria mercenaria TaxID=6596 RepID=UPI00234F542D|nr:uncharacterized protein LOC128545985 [Mercenaria mercenaria]
MKISALEMKMISLESLINEQTKEIKRLKTDDSAQKEQSEYEKSKLELQKSLIEFYREDILRMSALPQQQEGNLCDFKDVYVRPRMVIESKGNEADVLSMSDIFTKDNKTIKSIYVLGEAGSGKSSFCKSLINYWCLAHSEEEQSIEDEFSGVREMKKFNFLFHLPLRHYTEKTRIKEMLEEKYEHPALTKLLEIESRTCLFILDGLDEWASTPSKRPPERDALKQYTVLITSRPWKIATLGISDNEIRQKIIIKGFDDKASLKNMIGKTVPILNKTFEKDKVSSDCEMALENQSVENLKHTAIMLQQLICLWFDDKLRSETSRCALYSEMLDLFFDWHEKKYPDDPLFTEMMKKSEDLKNVELPRYLRDTEVCKSYSYIIQDVSQLAYETLFNNTKETSLSFDSSTFERLKISKEVKSCCLKLGILSEDKCISFSASKSRRSAIAFVHKSLQEYLAAVYIAIRCEKHTAPSADSGNADLSDHCAQRIKDIFSKCTTLDEVLEQANVFIMLCGLEPRIATFISKYIYDIVTVDKRVQEYRREIYVDFGHIHLITNIQKCIINCIEEVQACQTRIQSNFYLGDIIVGNRHYIQTDYHLLCTNVISPDSVISCNFYTGAFDFMNIMRVLKYFTKYQRLKAINIGDFHAKINGKDTKSICDVIEGNTSTLKTLCVGLLKEAEGKRIFRTIVRRLPEMSRLVTLQIKYYPVSVSLKDFISLCTFLSGSSQLEQIVIDDADCGFIGFGQHEVDLSKHHKLQCLKYGTHFTVICVNTSNLEIFKCSLESTKCVKVFDNLSTAYNLTELDLTCGYHFDFDNILSWHTVTDILITLLPLLNQLRKLTLSKFTFTDNIMKRPSEMKNMKFIELCRVTMSLTTWRRFVDSLPIIPIPVKVRASLRSITRDGEEYKPGRGEGEEEAAACKYVREQEKLFIVEREENDSISFSTRK